MLDALGVWIEQRKLLLLLLNVVHVLGLAEHDRTHPLEELVVLVARATDLVVRSVAREVLRWRLLLLLLLHGLGCQEGVALASR